MSTDRVYVNRTGDKVWSPNTKEQLCEAVEELSARIAALTAQRDAALARSLSFASRRPQSFVLGSVV